MRKKLLVSLVCALALASTSFGAVIGDWENNMDGWVVEWGMTTSYDTTGHTLNDNALKLVPNYTDWYVGSMDRVLTGAEMDLVSSGTATDFKLDVSRYAADWGFSGAWWIPESRLFLSVSFGLQNDDDEWYYYGAGAEALGGAWYPAFLGQEPWNRDVPPCDDPDGTMIVSWSLGAVKAAWDAAIANGYYRNGGMDIRIITNCPGYDSAVYYIDNARLVPEPATMSLLVLGGLALIRRKH